jgi:hypothetical protein
LARYFFYYSVGLQKCHQLIYMRNDTSQYMPLDEALAKVLFVLFQ